VTLTLGWKSAVVAAVLVVATGLGLWLIVRDAQKRDLTDWQRLQRIAELEKGSGLLLREIEKLRKESDGFRQQYEQSHEETIAAISKYKALLAIKNKTPEQEQETCLACKATVELLERDLAISEQDSFTLRQERTALIAALADSQEMFSLQTKRLKSAERSRRQIRRRNIWTMTSLAAASLTLGFGMGRL